MKNFFLIFFLLFLTNSNAEIKNFYPNVELNENEIKNLKKKWVYYSGLKKDTQSAFNIYENRIFYLDGNKNLRVIDFNSGKEICVNKDKPDRGYFRGVSLYEENQDKIYAIFFRHGKINFVNIKNCKLEDKLKLKLNVSVAPLIYNDLIIFLPNGSIPIAYNLKSKKKVWEANIDKKKLKYFKKLNKNQKLNWSVWGGGVIDKKNNQILFSTANPKPGYISKGRNGPNLFSNSVVALDLNSGQYKWHFQEIVNDLHNLDLASPPVLFSMEDKDLVAQATKSGQLIILNRKNGKPVFEFKEKKYSGLSLGESTYTIYKVFPEWLQFSRRFFKEDDINKLNNNFYSQAKKIISKSIISDYFPLSKDKNHIFYGLHGGAQWPGIAITDDMLAIIPSSDIAWIGRLTNSKDYNLNIYFNDIFKSIKKLITKFNKKNLKSLFLIFKNYKNIYNIDIYKYQRFATKNNIPLNEPPWGKLTVIDLKNQTIKWQVRHGTYRGLENIETGAEIFGSPVATSGGVVFLAGTDDKKIRAYSLENGKKIWEDELPYSSYGIIQILEYNNKKLLIVNSSGGRNFYSTKGDAVVAYKIKN